MSALRLMMLLTTIVATGCSVAPTQSKQNFFHDSTVLVSKKNSKNHIDQRYIDAKSLAGAETLRIFPTGFPEEFVVPGITQKQMDIVANLMSRTVCTELAPYFDYKTDADGNTLQLRARISGLRPTGVKTAGFSAAVGAVSPSPIRIPAGLGGLAGEVEIIDHKGKTYSAMSFARGASSFNGESLSSIGDAYQLAGEFANKFSAMVRKALPKSRFSKTRRTANRAMCLAQFGKTNIAGNVAGFLLPVSPETRDSGAPVPEVTSDQDLEPPQQ